MDGSHGLDLLRHPARCAVAIKCDRDRALDEELEAAAVLFQAERDDDIEGACGATERLHELAAGDADLCERPVPEA